MRVSRPRGASRRQADLPSRSEVSSPWMSYGDLFAGLLMIFALMLFTALYFYQSGVDGVREILLLRSDVVAELADALEESDSDVVAVSPEGVIQFADGLLFDYDSAEIQPDGREQLAVLVNQYLRVIFSYQSFVDRLERIVIEGHTDDVGSYLYNLNLSQARANAVMEVMMETADEAISGELQRLVTANGRSFSDLIYVDTESKIVDQSASRRIEIRFELNDQEVLQELVEKVFRGT